jgi:succinate dehydrogenase / fumarate reductase membrane anchor subunit
MAVLARPGKRQAADDEPRPRPRSGFELWAWLFMRLSGILLLFLAVGHVLIMHVLETGVERVDFNFVVDRWSSPFWRSWDWLMLSLALLHGINGVRVIIQDYVRRPGWRLAWNWTFATVGSALFVLGTIVVFTFDPTKFGVSP